MKKLYSLFAGLSIMMAFGQAGAPATPYYNGFNWNQTGSALRTALASKISLTHSRNLSYDEVWEALKVTDLLPSQTSNVMLIYGFSNNICPSSSSDDNDHKLRNKNSNGGSANCEWNREHTFAQSLGNPELGQTGPGADAHHLRASDVQRNGQRGNLKFAAGSGNSGTVSGGWYPGDEWKGDVARMMMYMYLRYGNRCLPTAVGTGSTAASDSNMLNLFLQWNAEDPVSQYEDNRNTYLGTTSNAYGQGNRNPFIDNPYLATLIWGGPIAQNRWPFLDTETFEMLDAVAVYPNPSNNHRINIDSDVVLDEIELININGQIIQRIQRPYASGNTYSLENLPSGFYFLKISAENQSTTKKVIVN
ncbi:T9SS type A sorting domain-containing protein [Flavobacterium sp. NST-5]|uniref:T9SS type A sorting domain-containing protein n=1 Tax=Flavobacterium ichthyis TaxID=2698827 RepID=A0ABW9Z5V2_9FLAO|nr:endonuclease [Flavobacterium ichthyis]NBL64221.1 T9SS type A sorting domain-containing protein [Flavobacterium ichthyis]